MSRRLGIRLDTLNPLALVAMVCVVGLTIFGNVPAEAALAAILGIAVPGHTVSTPPES